MAETKTDYFAHPTAFVDAGATIGAGTRIWHFCHVMPGAWIGAHCNLGMNVFVDNNTRMGNYVKVQNNVSIYNGVVLEDYVFCGPSLVFTNVINPRSEFERKDEFRTTHVQRGATLGANATIICGVTIGAYAMIGAGSVVSKDVPAYALMVGVPARQMGWISRHGQRLTAQNADGTWTCPQGGWRYREEPAGVLRCLDYPEEQPLPAN